MKKYKYGIIIGAVIAAVLAVVFWRCGTSEIRENIPEERGIASEAPGDTQNRQSADNEIEICDEPEKSTGENRAENTDSTKKTEKIDAGAPAGADNETAHYSKDRGMDINPDTGRDEYQTEPVPEGKPIPAEPEEAVISDKELVCTLSVRCDTILDNITLLDEDKISIIPSDGIIFSERPVTFYEGESVFNVLVREMKRNKIHMEFENTPIYNSAYIEGIANIYEFDCGELSGWMYKVNDWFPNYGCSRYQLKPGDKIEWVYTCNLGADVGGNYSTGNGR